MSCEIPPNWKEPTPSEYVFNGEYPWTFKSLYELWFMGEVEYPLDLTPIISIHSTGEYETNSKVYHVVVAWGGYKQRKHTTTRYLEQAMCIAKDLAAELSTDEKIREFIGVNVKY